MLRRMGFLRIVEHYTEYHCRDFHYLFLVPRNGLGRARSFNYAKPYLRSAVDNVLGERLCVA